MRLAFFTIVTPPDLCIAEYCVRAMVDAAEKLDHTVSIIVFFNGVPPRQQELIRGIKYSGHLEFRDNYEMISAQADSIRKQIGKAYVDASGITAAREGLYENGSVIWSRELLRISADFIAIVDADFEIFDPRFVDHMLGAFTREERLGFYSTDYTQTRRTFDTYSQTECIIHERNHTWFCIYRREALLKESDFEFAEQTGIDGLVKYDHSAMLQKRLKDNHHYNGAHLPAAMHWMYLHYGAFAKNRSLTGRKLGFYRRIRVLVYNGYRHRHGIPFLAKVLKLAGRVLNRLLRLNRFDQERRRYISPVGA